MMMFLLMAVGIGRVISAMFSALVRGPPDILSRSVIRPTFTAISRLSSAAVVPVAYTYMSCTYARLCLYRLLTPMPDGVYPTTER